MMMMIMVVVAGWEVLRGDSDMEFIDDFGGCCMVVVVSKKGVLTIKGMGDASGMSRYEFETEIPVSDADHLLSLCDQPLIEKTRYKYDFEDLTWEVDEFHGVNEGLVVAEVELESEDQQFNKPDFVGEEVTGQVKYYNMMLLKNPYTTW